MEQPDVAVVDIGLPDIDGIELVDRFRKFQASHEDVTTKVIMLTMHDSEEGGGGDGRPPFFFCPAGAGTLTA